MQYNLPLSDRGKTIMIADQFRSLPPVHENHQTDSLRV